MQNTLENNYMMNELSNTTEITDKLSPSESSRELKNNYMTLPLTITDKITNRLSPSIES
jgi:hypothetical protein